MIAKLVRRLVVNILIGNGDAHLKNWSVIDQDEVTPRLAPAYDLISTNNAIKSYNLRLYFSSLASHSCILFHYTLVLIST